MERRRAPCGSGERHDPHPYRVHVPDCPGWTGRDADVTDLADRLDRVALDHAWPLSLPPGIRLECHPSVVGALRDLFIPSREDLQAGLRTGEVPKPSVPVVVTAMGRGQWRITAGDGLIAEGVVRDD